MPLLFFSHKECQKGHRKVSDERGPKRPTYLITGEEACVTLPRSCRHLNDVWQGAGDDTRHFNCVFLPPARGLRLDTNVDDNRWVDPGSFENDSREHPARAKYGRSQRHVADLEVSHSPDFEDIVSAA